MLISQGRIFCQNLQLGATKAPKSIYLPDNENIRAILPLQGRAFVTQDANNRSSAQMLSTWVSDSGCTNRMTPYRSDFLEDSLRPIQTEIRSAGSQVLKSEWRGTVCLDSKQGRIFLKDVLYLPALRKRLLGVNGFDDEGIHTKYGNRKVVVSKGKRKGSSLKLKNSKRIYWTNRRDESGLYIIKAKILHPTDLESATAESMVAEKTIGGHVYDDGPEWPGTSKASQRLSETIVARDLRIAKDIAIDRKIVHISERNEAHLAYGFQMCEFAMLAPTYFGNLPREAIMHLRLSHSGVDQMRKSYPEFKFADAKMGCACEGCVKGKMHQMPLYKSKRRKKDWKPLEAIEADLGGPWVPSSGRKRYHVSFVDVATGFMWVRHLKRKSDQEQALREFLREIKTQYGATPKVFKTDMGGEFSSLSQAQLMTRNQKELG